jgi:hypothetical protein
VTTIKLDQLTTTSLTLVSILCLTACTDSGQDADSSFTAGLDTSISTETSAEGGSNSNSTTNTGDGDGDDPSGDGDGAPGDGDGEPGDGDGDADSEGDGGNTKFDLGQIGDAGNGQGGNFGPGSCRSSEIYGASGGFPAYEDPAYADYLEKTVAIVTHNANASVNPSAMVSIVDISGDPPPPNMYYAAPIYSNPSWTLGNLGHVFGLTLDSDGNMYLAPSTVWGGTQFPGTIKKIDAITGAISDLASIPNSGPALGNINYDCVSESIYVANMEDGRIYQIDMDGDIVSTYDHATGDVTMGPANEPGEPNGSFVPLGERPWAIQSNAGRLYYSVWVEHGQASNANENNSVWSVAYVSDNGVPDPGTAVKELEVPGVNGSSSQPVSDISFAHNGWMLVAQRTMYGDMQTSAHQSTTFEYDYQNGDWVFQGTTYIVGELLPYSAAGGVDHDFVENGYVWMTGDALDFYTPNCVYGLQGTPYGGGGIMTSTLIDMDHEIMGQDKTAYGDVELPIPGDVNPVPPPG